MAVTKLTIKHIKQVYRNPLTGGPRVSGIVQQNGEVDDPLAEQMKYNVIKLVHEFSCLHDTEITLPMTQRQKEEAVTAFNNRAENQPGNAVFSTEKITHPYPNRATVAERSLSGNRNKKHPAAPKTPDIVDDDSSDDAPLSTISRAGTAGVGGCSD